MGVLGAGRGGGRWQGFKEAAIHVVWEGYKEPRDSSTLKTYRGTCCSERKRERERDREGKKMSVSYRHCGGLIIQ